MSDSVLGAVLVGPAHVYPRRDIRVQAVRHLLSAHTTAVYWDSAVCGGVLVLWTG